METIPNKFRKNGFDYTLLDRQGDILLFEQSKDFGSDGVVRQYEVHKVRLKSIPTGKYDKDGKSIKTIFSFK